MSFWSKLLGREKAQEAESEPPPEEPPDPCDEETPNSLDLGWYWSENKGQRQMAKIAESDRATHFYVIGATGTGKTKFLEFLIQQDIENGNGFGVIDPHGDLVEEIKGLLACRYVALNDDEEVTSRVVLVDPTDPRSTVTFNPLERLPNVSVPEQVAELLSSFKKIWSESWGVRMEDLMRNALIALGEAELTLLELPQFLTNRAFRASVLIKVSHPIARDYFRTRFDTLTDRGQVSWIEPVMNKVNAFLSDERIRQMFSSGKSTFNLREVMDQKKMLLVKLDKGKLKDSSDLLGSLLMAKIMMAAFSRSDVSPSKRTPFYLYIDEFQNFATESFSTVLSEARKYGLSLVMAHQTLAQIPEELKSLILGNAGIQVCFRLNRHDAQGLAKEAFRYSGFEVKTVHGQRPSYWSFAEEWEHKTEELQDLEPRTCFVKHKIKGGLIPIHTVEMVQATDVLGVSEEEYHDFLRSVPFGEKYLVPRDEIVAAARERTGRIKQEHPAAPPEEREKKRGVVRDIASRRKDEKAEEETAEPEEPPPMETKTPPPSEAASARQPEKTKKVEKEKEKAETLKFAGKGGPAHTYLQTVIKNAAEARGFKATIEKPTPEGGLVDVGIERDGQRIACEISMTTNEKQELSNIEKCLAAGYGQVVVCSPEKRTLDKVKALASVKLSEPEREKVLFMTPAELIFHLEKEAAKRGDKEERVKGYKVKVKYTAVEEEAEKEAKREAIAKVILDTFRKMKRDE